MKGEELLKRRFNENEDRAKKLWEEATEKEVIFGIKTGDKNLKHHIREFKVKLYPENTEFVACLLMLSDISKWFQVIPVTKE